MVVDVKLTVNMLQRIPLFAGLNRRQLESLARRFVERKFDAGETIVTQGRGGEGFFVVISGRAEAIREHADGEKTVLNPLEPGDFFGEMALLSEGIRTASVVATEPTTCLVLARWDFLGVLREDAEMAVVILQELAERFVRVLNTL